MFPLIKTEQKCSRHLFYPMPGNIMINYQVHPTHTTIRITLPVLPIMGQPIMYIALSMLPIIIITITLSLAIQWCYPATSRPK